MRGAALSWLPSMTGFVKSAPALVGSVIVDEDLPYLADRVVDQHVPGSRVGPPPAQRRVEHQAEQNGSGEDPVDQGTRPSVASTGLPSAWPVRVLPAASANITAAVTAVHAMPSAECRGW